MARVEHIKYIQGVTKLSPDWKSELPSYLKYSVVRTFNHDIDDFVAYHMDKPLKTYNIEYILTKGDIVDLSIRYHRMFITHELAFNLFEKIDWERNGILVGQDTADDFKRKLKAVVVLSDTQIVNVRSFNEQLQTYVETPTPTKFYYLVPYEIFRQCMFVKRVHKVK